MKGAKRFYKAVSVADQTAEAGALLLLDGKPVKTPARHALGLPNRAVAEAVAEEWRAQGEEIVPETMPLTRLANTAIDGVQARKAEVIGDIVGFAATDLLCYRAEGPEGLVAMQSRHWNPILNWSKQHFGAHFRLAEGVIHVGQPAEALTAIRGVLNALDSFSVAALHVMTALTGSALLSLAVLEGRLSVDEAWSAAHVDEDWQISQWGSDADAADRRIRRYRDYEAAADMLRMLEV